MEFMRRTKYTRKNYKTMKIVLSEFKINPIVKKIQNYGNKWIQHVRRMDRDGQTATLNYGISTVRHREPRTTLIRLIEC